MANRKVKVVLLSLVLCLVPLKISWAEEPKSNEEFLRETVVQMLNQSMEQVLAQTGDTVYLREEGSHPASWLLEEEAANTTESTAPRRPEARELRSMPPAMLVTRENCSTRWLRHGAIVSCMPWRAPVCGSNT